MDGIRAMRPQTSPATAIPFPPFLVAIAAPPIITARIPQIMPPMPVQQITKDRIPNIIDATASPLVGLDCIKT